MDYRNELGNWEEIILEPSGDTLPIGAITEFGGETAPTNWLFCNGQAVSRETYAELFSVIGTTYGDGDGSTTFNVPDFSSRSPMGVGTGTDGTNSETTTLGQEKGEYKHALKENEMPEHSHKIGAEGAILYGGNRVYFSSAGSVQTWASNDAHSHTSTKGGGQTHNTIHPVLGVNFIIKAKQSIGIVGTVSEDINDTNNNAVPTCKTVKNYVDNVPNIVLDGPEVKMNYKVDGKYVYAKKFTLGNGVAAGKQKSFDLTKFGFTADNHTKIRFECVNNFGYQLPNITGDGWSQYGWLNSATVYKIKNGDLIDTTGDTLYLTIYYTKTTD